jgi:hypothetical protein
MHTKIIIFAVCPNFSTFLCNCPDFFFLKAFSRLYRTKQKKIIMHIHHKKALSVFPQFSNFPGNFSSFSLHKNLIRIVTNIKKKNYPNRSSRSHRKKHFQFFPNFPIFLATFPIFFLFKLPLK